MDIEMRLRALEENVETYAERTAALESVMGLLVMTATRLLPAEDRLTLAEAVARSAAIAETGGDECTAILLTELHRSVVMAAGLGAG